MSNIRISPLSPFYQAVITLPDGSRTNRSTKIRVKGGSKSEAERIAAEFQAMEDKAGQRNLTTEHVKRVFNDICERVGIESLNQQSIEDFFNEWLAGKLVESTKERYERPVTLFKTYLGNKSKSLVSAISYTDVLGYMASRKKEKTAPTTLRLEVKILGSAFNVAKKLGIRSDNPVEKALTVQPLEITSSERDDFTPGQIADLFKTAKGEWLTASMLGYYLGARLGDCVRMKWDNVDLTKGVIEYVPTKNKKKCPKPIVVPIHPDLEAHLNELASSDKPDTYLCPTLATKGPGGRRGLSQSFTALMAKAGIDSKTAQGQGTRKFSKLSFHSLRHSFNSVLANQGVDQETRMALIGHNTKAINSGYTHHDLSKLKSAIAKLPTL